MKKVSLWQNVGTYRKNLFSTLHTSFKFNFINIFYITSSLYFYQYFWFSQSNSYFLNKFLSVESQISWRKIIVACSICKTGNVSYTSTTFLWLHFGTRFVGQPAENLLTKNVSMYKSKKKKWKKVFSSIYPYNASVIYYV